MKTQGEIEAAICEGISRFEQDYMGRGPKDIHAHLIGDLLVVRLQGVLTAAEQQLVKSLPAEKGRDLLKQVRTHLIETARPVMEAMVQEITGVKVLSLHHDISTVTGEEVRPVHPGRVASFPRSEEIIRLLSPLPQPQVCSPYLGAADGQGLDNATGREHEKWTVIVIRSVRAIPAAYPGRRSVLHEPAANGRQSGVADGASQEGSLTMIIHEVWIDGGATPLVLELKDDELFQHFKRWVEKDNSFTANGWVGTLEGKTWVVNFQKIAVITTTLKRDRGSMGFGTT